MDPNTTTKPTYTLPKDAVFLITGCSSGLGLALSRLIANHPTHRLVATARDQAKLESLLLGNTTKTNDRILILSLDVTSTNSITTALATILTHPGFGRMDVLINNAGHGLMGDTETSLPYHPSVPHSSDAEHAKARAVVEVDFWGAAAMTLHAVRVMREDNARNGGGPQGGLVLQVTSMGGFMGFAGNAYYHAAKFGLEGFTESLSREVRPEWNIHFTIAEPGGIDTNYATSSMSLLANHPAYDAPDSPARVLAAYIDNPEFRRSWSRPENMAKAIYEVVSRGQPIPMRFPLGTVSWQTLRAEADNIVKEFDDMRHLSVSVDSVEQAEHVERVKEFASK
ncbi:hypothetical protein VP1G_03333 [Cytospora mali]|uniref:Retinol dehydrogenase 8 n=1 Tax=Cytospora mali TaxID=578113 RepID=A0A194UWB4_CYTMA|nr:hypothetical protein VP1G_03333 [Valsa mali var. pyri (nom. inval.)]